MDDRRISLYLHVPFCAHKCEYCAFYSHAPGGDLLQRFTNALCRELEMIPRFAPYTIFFGGGTPSLLTLRQWEQIGATLERLNFAQPLEWTVECNPATVSLDKARLFRAIGVNRISMGVQSLDESLLERLGRIHSREMVFKSYEILRQAGVANVNLDLMFGIPGQTMEIWRRTLDETIALQPEHLSSYEVIYEEDTPLYEQLRAGQFSVDEELVEEMYEELVSRSGGAGYHQYEISNFARSREAFSDVPDLACGHNVQYWRGGFYYALGPSAAGYEPVPDNLLGVRTKNWANTTMYCELVEQGKRPIESREELTPAARAGELAAFGLRMNSGWPLREFQSKTGFSLEAGWAAEMEQLEKRGLANRTAERFHLTSSGLRFADAAGAEFLR